MKDKDTSKLEMLYEAVVGPSQSRGKPDTGFSNNILYVYTLHSSLGVNSTSSIVADAKTIQNIGKHIKNESTTISPIDKSDIEYIEPTSKLDTMPRCGGVYIHWKESSLGPLLDMSNTMNVDAYSFEDNLLKKAFPNYKITRDIPDDIGDIWDEVIGD